MNTLISTPHLIHTYQSLTVSHTSAYSTVIFALTSQKARSRYSREHKRRSLERIDTLLSSTHKAKRPERCTIAGQIRSRVFDEEGCVVHRHLLCVFHH